MDEIEKDQNVDATAPEIAAAETSPPPPPNQPKTSGRARSKGLAQAALTTAPDSAETPKRTPAEIARELHPDCEDFRCNSAGDVTCKNGRGQTVLVPASKIAQYQ